MELMLGAQGEEIVGEGDMTGGGRGGVGGGSNTSYVWRGWSASPEAHRSPVANGKRSVSGYASVENMRKVHGRKASLELVEERVLEDGPDRSISMWRERVAQSSAGGPTSEMGEEVRTDLDSHVHRRNPSGDSRTSRRTYNMEYSRPRAESVSSPGVKRRELPSRSIPNGYERSEYMVMYQKPQRNGAIPPHLHPPSEVGAMSSKSSNKRSIGPTSPRMPTSVPKSPTQRKTSGRSTQQSRDYIIPYNTPPRSQGSLPSSSSPNGHTLVQNKASSSPLLSRTYVPIDSADDNSMIKGTSTSSVELILTSCEPSLLHIAPILSELGITRLEHLRAINRLSEETRDREVKEEALRKGVTVMEWAILVDKLQTL
ncbi:hypothetical protein K474DRAFT_1705610 [Panus rudis PR-1116 ss-1]|nr:hypothetical protein K474DRAFT_1705610 [Panus rudis PR-1116 ss-1]